MTAGADPAPLVGVLLAAGRGRRMGRTKQLVLWPTPAGDRPLVAVAFDAIRPVCREMIVVVGHEAAPVVAALGDRVFTPLPVAAEAEMIESIRAGLRAVRELDPTAAALVHPADHAEVAAGTLDEIVAAHRAAPERAIMPAHGGRGGHPVLIPPVLLEPILDTRLAGGLRQFWRDHPDRCVRLEVSDATVVQDVDTPEEYARRRENAGR